MYLYLDLIWILNVCIDFLLLWLTALFRKQQVRKWRLAIAAMLGASYVFLLLFPPLSTLLTFLLKFSLSIVLVLIAFDFKHLQNFTLNFLMFYFVSFVTGGGIFAFHFFLQNQHEVIRGMVATQSSGYGDPVSWLFVVLGFSFMYSFTKTRWNQLERTKLKEGVLVRVKGEILGNAFTCQGLVDTGNQLYDPLTKTPVMMLELQCLKHVLPQKLLNHFEQCDDPLQMSVVDLDPHWTHRIRMIPYRGVRQDMNLMVALRPDYVTVSGREGTYKTRKVVIGINKQAMSKEGQYQAIVHPSQIQSNHAEEAI